MAGGLMQLVAYGAQDVYLTGNPKVTFFQAVYKRHTNFAMENIEQTVNGTAANSGRVSVTIARNGDLVGDMYVELQSAAANTSTADGDDACWVAERAIASAELSIGGQRIDKHYQRWWRLYSELYLDESKKANWAKMTTAKTGNTVYLPLIFFFNRNPGLYLPLIALQYHEVRIDFDLTSTFSTYLSTSVFKVWANYVYLDTEERRRFAQRVTNTLLNKCNTLVPTPSLRVPPPTSVCLTTTQSRNLCGASTTQRLVTLPPLCGTLPRPQRRLTSSLNAMPARVPRPTATCQSAKRVVCHSTTRMPPLRTSMKSVLAQ